jgi:methylthioribose-1-phosphate isomerase
MKFSPLFWPVTYHKGVIRILDETQLPLKMHYLVARDYRSACRAITQMKTRAVGQVILVFYIFLQALHRAGSPAAIRPQLETISAAINATRPTVSFAYLTDMVRAWPVEMLEKNILGFLEGLKHARIRQAQEAAQLLVDGDCVLTHCNISGLMPLIAEFAKERGARVTFIVTETRPYLQGARLTAWELARMGFAVTVIGDAMVAQVMSEGKVTKVIVGADHLARNGDIANKVGTYQIALLAKHFSIPFIAVCPPATRSATGKDITIEVRPDDELLCWQGKRIAPKGVKGYYPAFDVTPHELISTHINLGVK